MTDDPDLQRLAKLAASEPAGVDLSAIDGGETFTASTLLWPIQRLVIHTDNNDDGWFARMSADGTVDLHPSLQDKSPQEVATAILHGLSGR